MPQHRSSAAIRTAEQAAAYLGGLLDVEKRPGVPYARLGLEAIRRLLARLGNPERELAVIHVAGSKGKGSTALLAEAVCRAAGERVATYTSPHLERWTERFRIDGREVDGGRLAEVVDRLRPHVDALRAEAPASAPTFFDATTAAALLLFREANVQRAILEVGLGGRLDSTNVVTPSVACITSVELEHTDKLGTSLAQIAREKAGVLKPGVPAVAGDLPAEAREVVAARAREIGAPLAWLAEDFGVELLGEDSEGLRLRLADGPLRLEVGLPVLGAHQAANAALALACVRRAGGLSDSALASAAAQGLARVELPGRVELLGRAPWVVVDAAHTAASSRALARALAHLPRRRSHLVLSISSGKDAARVLRWLLPEASEVTVTRAEPSRSLAPAEIAAAVRAAAPRIPLRVVPNPHLAIRAARAGLAADDLLCVTGSVYLAGIGRGVLRERAGSPQATPTRGGNRAPLAEP